MAKQFLPRFKGLEIFADKIYRSEEWQVLLEQNNKIYITPPVKLKAGQKMLDNADKLFSEALSGTRQAIESFFSWGQEKTALHRASKVRSLKALLSFIYARLAVVCIFLAARLYRVSGTVDTTNAGQFAISINDGAAGSTVPYWTEFQQPNSGGGNASMTTIVRLNPGDRVRLSSISSGVQLTTNDRGSTTTPSAILTLEKIGN